MSLLFLIQTGLLVLIYWHQTVMLKEIRAVNRKREREWQERNGNRTEGGV